MRRGVRSRFLTSCCVSVLPPCATPPIAQVGEHGAGERARVDAAVGEEAVVLGGEHRLPDALGQVGEAHRDARRAAAVERLGEHLGLEPRAVGRAHERPPRLRDDGDHLAAPAVELQANEARRPVAAVPAMAVAVDPHLVLAPEVLARRLRPPPHSRVAHYYGRFEYSLEAASFASPLPGRAIQRQAEAYVESYLRRTAAMRQS